MFRYVLGGLLVCLVGYFLGAKRKFKNAVLGKVALLPGEQILHDDTPVTITVVSHTQHGTGVHPNAIVRITNQRLIIAQKPWFSKKPPEQWPLLLIMHRSSDLALPGGATSGLLSVGYRTVGIGNTAVAQPGGNNEAVVSVTVVAPGDMTQLEKVMIETLNSKIYL